MLLDNPTLELRIEVQDILEILENILKEKNWKNFDVASLKLMYMPFYIFNYDTLVETEIQGQPYSQGFSGMMAMNAITGELEPILSDTMETRSVKQVREITHDLQYELQKPAISLKEVKDSAQIKLAGQFNLRKKDLAVSGFRLFYWPIWRIFVQLKNRVQRVDVEAIDGNPLNFEQVPIREKTWMEVTGDTFKKLKTTKGWAEIGGSVISGASSGAQNVGRSGIFDWLFKTQMGLYTLLAIAALIAVLFFLT